MKTKNELIEHYSRKEPNLFHQIEGFYLPEGGDYFRHPDKDGDCICWGDSYELMSGVTNLRVLITPGTTKATVIRLLEKMVDDIKRDPDFMCATRKRHVYDQRTKAAYNELKIHGYSEEEIVSAGEFAKMHSIEKQQDEADQPF